MCWLWTQAAASSRVNTGATTMPAWWKASPMANTPEPTLPRSKCKSVSHHLCTHVDYKLNEQLIDCENLRRGVFD